MRMAAGNQRKPSTNLSLSHGIKGKANEVMEVLSFDNLTAFVEQLIRDKHAELFGVNPQTRNNSAESDEA
jgi:hypothetical protein